MDLLTTINNIHAAQGQPEMNPLLANTILGQGMAASNAVQKKSADEKVARPAPEFTIGQDPSTGEPFIKRATNLPLMNKPAQAADAAAKPMEDAYAALGRGGFLNITPAGDTSTPATRGTAFAPTSGAAQPDQYAMLAQHGYAVPQASNAAADTSSFGGAYRASRDLGNKPARAAFDALLQSRGRGDTQGFVNKVANQRTATAEKLAAPIEAQDRADARLFDSLTNPANLQQYGTAEQAKSLIGQQVKLTPERSQYIDSAWANMSQGDTASAARAAKKDMNARIAGIGAKGGESVLSYGADEWSRYAADNFPEGFATTFDAGRAQRAFDGTQKVLATKTAKEDRTQMRQDATDSRAETSQALSLATAARSQETAARAVRTEDRTNAWHQQSETRQQVQRLGDQIDANNKQIRKNVLAHAKIQPYYPNAEDQKATYQQENRDLIAENSRLASGLNALGVGAGPVRSGAQRRPTATTAPATKVPTFGQTGTVHLSNGQSVKGGTNDGRTFYDLQTGARLQ